MCEADKYEVAKLDIPHPMDRATGPRPAGRPAVDVLHG